MLSVNYHWLIFSTVFNVLFIMCRDLKRQTCLNLGKKEPNVIYKCPLGLIIIVILGSLEVGIHIKVYSRSKFRDLTALTKGCACMPETETVQSHSLYGQGHCILHTFHRSQVHSHQCNHRHTNRVAYLSWCWRRRAVRTWKNRKRR